MSSLSKSTLALLCLVVLSSPAFAYQGQRFQMRVDKQIVATIDVFEVDKSKEEEMLKLALELVKLAENDKDFVAGALHKGRPAEVQPLEEFGFVPQDKAWVGIYAQWKSDGHRKGFAGNEEGQEILTQASHLSPGAKEILADPNASLFQPALLDATGELCNHNDCEEGRNVGPIIDVANPVTQFINVFTTTADRQEKLLAETFKIMPVARKHEGYWRTALHTSVDGKKVANYGQYENFEQISAMYYHFKTFLAFGKVLFKNVTDPIFCILGSVCVGNYPRLRTYTVEYIGIGNYAGDLYVPVK